MNSVRLALAVCVALVVGASGRAGAQESADQYPSRAVSFIVPFAPGGVTGLFARLLGQKLEQRLGKPFVVEHRPGGGGVTAATAVARAAPDGYTLILASSTVMAINVTVRKNLPYDPRKELTPIALLARVPFVLVVNPQLPVNSVADLVKLAKEKPGQLSFGTPGPGTFHHLNAEIFKSMFGAESNANKTNASIKGGPREEMRTRLVTGEYFSTLGVKPLLGRFFTAADERYHRALGLFAGLFHVGAAVEKKIQSGGKIIRACGLMRGELAERQPRRGNDFEVRHAFFERGPRGESVNVERGLAA